MIIGAVSAARLERLFVKSSYLTYFLAAGCLAWSEAGLVSEIGAIAAVAGLLILLAYFLEGRWSLTGFAANVMGAAILTLAGLWVAVQWMRTSDSVLTKLPWPTSMVPLVGPILLLLLVGKLLRPKVIADHWALQGIALVCVGLGCTLADDVIFGSLMLMYWLSTIWCLGIFFIYRERLKSEGASASAQLPRVRQLLSWIFPVMFVALVGFFVLPRSEQVWQLPGKKKTDVGISEEQSISLNNTGTLELDPEVAFEVFVQDRNGNPKNDLPSDQRWRGPFFRTYLNGSWHRFGGSSRSGPGAMSAVAPRLVSFDAALPETNQVDQFTITFTVKAKIGQIPFLYDPIYMTDDTQLPVLQILPSGELEAWRQETDGLLRPRQPVVPGKTKYRQVCVPPRTTDLSHPVKIESLNPLNALRSQPANLPNLKAWTTKLLERLVNDGALDRAALEDRDVRGDINPIYYETIARALENHLARSGEYKYTLTLDRTDPTIDPVEDFLYNTKSGHCNRFTTALAVMLRSLQIPCQVVLGYRGADSRGDGHYEIRQCYAHSWVEVLVPRRGPAPRHGMFAGDESWHWLTVDPTPDDAEVQANAVGNRWWSATFDWRRLFTNLIVNYNADNRDELLNDIWMRTKEGVRSLVRVLTSSTAEGFRARIAAALMLLALAAILAILVRWLGRKGGKIRAGKPAPGVEFQRRLLAILARRGLRPAAGQTSREFADSIAQVLHERPQGGEMNQVVHSASELFYRVRFGQIALTPEERQQVNSRLDWLSAALSKRGD